jgi:hypothetical protein
LDRPSTAQGPPGLQAPLAGLQEGDGPGLGQAGPPPGDEAQAPSGGGAWHALGADPEQQQQQQKEQEQQGRQEGEGELYVPDLFAAAQRGSPGAGRPEALRFSGKVISARTSEQGSSSSSSSSSSSGAAGAAEDMLLDATDEEEDAGDADGQGLEYVPTFRSRPEHRQAAAPQRRAGGGGGQGQGGLHGWRALGGLLNALLPGRLRSSGDRKDHPGQEAEQDSSDDDGGSSGEWVPEADQLVFWEDEAQGG